MFDTWMHRNGLSLNTAAEALGISRRMVSYYRTVQKFIPRAIWLACLGWEATKPKPKLLPRALPTAREYALTMPERNPNYETNPTVWGRQKGHFAKQSHFPPATEKAILRNKAI